MAEGGGGGVKLSIAPIEIFSADDHGHRDVTGRSSLDVKIADKQ